MSETKVRVHQPARSSQWADSSDAELDRTVPNESASANHGHPEHESLEVRAGFAVRKHKLVKSGGLDDLVLQSVQNGHAMNDQNILKRHLQPAARKLGLPFVNWRCLRTSHATWLIQAGADVKSVQGQMRHSEFQHHAGYLRSNHFQQSAASAAATHSVCRRRRDSARGAANGDGSRPRFFEFRRRFGSAVQFTVQNGPINWFFKCTRTAQNHGK